MFGIFDDKESEVDKASRLAHDFFEALKTDDPDIFKDKKFAKASLDKCFVADKNTDELTINIQEQEIKISVKAGGLISCKAWSDTKVRAFVDFRARFKKGVVGIYTPLSYLVEQGKIEAVEYLLQTRRLDPNEGVEVTADCSGSCLKPLYFAAEQKEMAKLLTAYDARVSNNMMILSMASSPPDIMTVYAQRADIAFIRMSVVQKFHTLEATNEFLDKMGLSVLTGEEFAQLSAPKKSADVQEKLINSDQHKKTDKENAKKKASYESTDVEPAHIVRIERDMGKSSFVDIYDFKMHERVMMIEIADGTLQPTFRQNFNAIGRSDRGLQEAFKIYAQKGGALSLDDLFDKPAQTKLAIKMVNPSSSISGQ